MTQITEVSVQAAHDARELGIQSRAVLCNMLQHAAPVSHDLGNFRYEQYVFDVQDGVVLSVSELPE